MRTTQKIYLWKISTTSLRWHAVKWTRKGGAETAAWYNAPHYTMSQCYLCAIVESRNVSWFGDDPVIEFQTGLLGLLIRRPSERLSHHFHQMSQNNTGMTDARMWRLRWSCMPWFLINSRIYDGQAVQSEQSRPVRLHQRLQNHPGLMPFGCAEFD